MTRPASGATAGQELNLTGRSHVWPDSLVAMWQESLVAATGDTWGRGWPWQGWASLRSALQTALGSDDDLSITSGVRAAIPAFALFGRRVIVESPGFEGIRRMFELCGAEVDSHPLNRALELATPADRYLLWVTSPGRNPDGWSVTPADCDRLADFAARGGIVVQNEMYRWFDRGGLRIPGAYRIGSLHKIAGSRSRIGWLTGNLIGPLEAQVRSCAPAALWQAAWARFAGSGGLRTLIDRADRVAALAADAASLLAEPADRDAAAAMRGPSVLVQLVGNPVARLRAAGVLAGPGPDFRAPADTARLSFLGCTASCDHAAVVKQLRELGARLVTPVERDEPRA